jgi:beta-xylosidase
VKLLFKYFLISAVAATIFSVAATWARVPTGSIDARTSSIFNIANSSDNGYTYGYAPSIVKENGIYHAFYCSTPARREGLDAIRYVFSKDGPNWSRPRVILRAKPSIDSKTGKSTNRAACDPSLVYYQDYYYLFYSNQHQTGSELGARPATQTTISVARSRQIDGVYLTYTERGTWEENPADVKMIVLPQIERSGKRYNYGAGQQTVVVKNGQLYMWYTDDSLQPNAGPRIYFLQSNDPVNWNGTPVPTNLIKASSVDIKYDAKKGRFVLAHLLRSHQASPSLATAYSADGINWRGFRTLDRDRKFPAFAHNLGISGDREGHLIDGENPIVAFGAPYNLNSRDRWGNWDLFGVRVNVQHFSSL